MTYYITTGGEAFFL